MPGVMGSSPGGDAGSKGRKAKCRPRLALFGEGERRSRNQEDRGRGSQAEAPAATRSSSESGASKTLSGVGNGDTSPDRTKLGARSSLAYFQPAFDSSNNCSHKHGDSHSTGKEAPVLHGNEIHRMLCPHHDALTGGLLNHDSTSSGV
jgi:hypothetical protein